MRGEDYYPKGKRWWVRLHEKGGKRHEMPAYHNVEAYLDPYQQRTLTFSTDPGFAVQTDQSRPDHKFRISGGYRNDVTPWDQDSP